MYSLTRLESLTHSRHSPLTYPHACDRIQSSLTQTPAPLCPVVLLCGCQARSRSARYCQARASGCFAAAVRTLRLTTARGATRHAPAWNEAGRTTASTHRSSHRLHHRLHSPPPPTASLPTGSSSTASTHQLILPWRSLAYSRSGQDEGGRAPGLFHPSISTSARSPVEIAICASRHDEAMVMQNAHSRRKGRSR